MILPAPQISDELRAFFGNGNYRDQPVKTRYPGYEACFVCFHPFMRIKDPNEGLIVFKRPWPDKTAIQTHCEPVSWTDILQLTGIPDYKRLDCVLAFYHSAHRYTRKSDFEALYRLLTTERQDLIAAQVDKLPEILQDKVLGYLRDLGYDALYEYCDSESRQALTPIVELMSEQYILSGQQRIESPDGKLMIATDFDQRFTYFLGPLQILEGMIESLNLEGFFCDDEMPESWSYETPPREDLLDWSLYQVNPVPESGKTDFWSRLKSWFWRH